MPAHLADVARQAGVSEATASRVMNGRPYVAATTRLRVEAAARRLAYVPHRAARDLSMARTSTVALLVHHAQYPIHGEGTFSARILDGASRALHRRGYDLLYVSIDDDAASRLRALAVLHRGRTDGALVLGPALPPEAVATIRSARRPVVLIDNRIEGLDAVLAQNRRGATLMARHLVDDHGYRRLACIAGPESWPSTAERVAGTRRVARRAGASLRIIHASETTMRSGAESVDELLDDPPDAIVAVNDAMALGALHRLRRLPARRRPAIVGFDDVAWALLTDPPLTTVRVDTPAMGSRAVEVLLERIGNTNANIPPARDIRLPVELCLRRSCGCGPERRAPSRRASG